MAEKLALYSIRQAAHAVGIAYPTLQFWLLNGAVIEPKLKVGCRRFYTPEEIKELKAFVKDRDAARAKLKINRLKRRDSDEAQ